MSDHPLGDIDGTSGTDAPSPVSEPSIVDQILDLDKLLSADVRRAERTARFCTAPHLQADIEALEAELETLTDDRGNPLDEEGMNDSGRTATGVALEIRAKRQEMADAMVSVRMRQLELDQWEAFLTKHRATSGEERPMEFWFELISLSACAPVMTQDQAARLTKKYGRPVLTELSTKAWQVNTESGVSVPKSSRSSAVLRRAARG
ncbi:hypothetical protein [Nocardioides speluncae]|uniref:hypothetical protein n=1 Tax=Nocardioides speluncae TaxID=2670337 RepID=UPI000D69C2AD|nr:hypothetical protein [Nocardioides speluncae]